MDWLLILGKGGEERLIDSRYGRMCLEDASTVGDSSEASSGSCRGLFVCRLCVGCAGGGWHLAKGSVFVCV